MLRRWTHELIKVEIISWLWYYFAGHRHLSCCTKYLVYNWRKMTFRLIFLSVVINISSYLTVVVAGNLTKTYLSCLIHYIFHFIHKRMYRVQSRDVGELNSWLHSCMIIINISCCGACFGIKIWLMVYNTTFKNISGISWRSVLLVEETGVPEEKHQPVASNWQALSQNGTKRKRQRKPKGNKEWTINLETESALATKHYTQWIPPRTRWSRRIITSWFI